VSKGVNDGTPEGFDAIEKKMREIVARDKPFLSEWRNLD
jgi:hypothetical protein